MKTRMSDLKGFKGKELEVKLKEARDELLKLNAQSHGSAPPKNPHAIKNLKRAIARLLTMQKNEVTK